MRQDLTRAPAQLDGRLAESRIEFEAAIALDRNNARAYYNLGHTLALLGQPKEPLGHRLVARSPVPARR